MINGFDLKPLVWMRYIDDMVMIWTHGRDQLDKFVKYLNDGHTTIKFTMECSSEKVCFLDTWLIKDQETNELYTTVYTKPTDTHDYLDFSSSHPSHCKTAGPKGQLLRIRRICKKDEDFESHSENMIAHYIRRGYPKRILKKHLTEIQKYSQKELLLPKSKSEKGAKGDRMTLVLDYNPANPDIIGILKKNWNSLEVSPHLGELFKEIPMLAHKRTKNLRDILCKATINFPPEKCEVKAKYNNRPKPCKRVRCPICPTHSSQQTVQCLETKATYKIPRILDCETRNLIYCILCKTCGKQYVGETLRSLRERINEHLGDIHQKRQIGRASCRERV
jgi:hypothetical protein